jgi:hypothetical protein
MYEAIRFCLDYSKKKQRKRYVTLNLKARDEDGKRWAEEKLYWPIEEVN